MPRPACGGMPNSPVYRPFVFAGTPFPLFFALPPIDGIFQRPLTLEEAVGRVQSWLDQPCVRIVHPTEQHWPLFRDLLICGKATASLVADAHLAALALEHGCQLNSTDADFARFPRLNWRNPLTARAE